jgi:ABC-type multidrug transport system fused ATPase/permease subunit
VRKSEIDKIREIYNVSTINIFLLWCAPVLVSTISIGVYQYLVEILKLSDMLACITIFNMIQEPIRNLPWMFNTLMETLVSLKRIEVFIL